MEKNDEWLAAYDAVIDLEKYFEWLQQTENLPLDDATASLVVIKDFLRRVK